MALSKKCTEVAIIPYLQEFNLKAQTELRFEVEPKNIVVLELKKGDAQIFGCSLAKFQKYTFTCEKIAVFSWEGCTLELNGKPEVAYVAEETPMIVYTNLCAAIKQKQMKAEKENSKAPVVLVAGPLDVGKTTLCQILINYSVLCGRKPVFVDLDVALPSISIPGTISAQRIERLPDVGKEYFITAPLVYYYGHTNPGTNLLLFNKLVSQLSTVVAAKEKVIRQTGISGTVINTGGWTQGDGYQALLLAAKAFEVDMIVVIDQERLYHKLVKDISMPTECVLVPKSGGVVERSLQTRAKVQDSLIRQYFYNTRNSYPYSFDIKFSEMNVYKIGAPSLSDSCMPMDMKSEDNRAKLVHVPNDINLLHHVLGISNADNVNDDVVTTHTLDFICVTNVDLDRRIVTVLSPIEEPLPKTIFIMGDIQFIDAY